jgi:hypothetical protein
MSIAACADPAIARNANTKRPEPPDRESFIVPPPCDNQASLLVSTTE